MGAAGDAVCPPASAVTATACRQKATSDLLVALNPSVVAALGDLQYESGRLADFQAAYHPTWGRLKAKTKPAVGNHEYRTAGASGYFSYFGAAAGPASKGYYSYNLGSWHVVVLNSNCSFVSCAAGSAQEKWLRADLAANPTSCTLAYWHHPRFSSATHGDEPLMAPIYKALHDRGADVALAAHSHAYERFAAQGPARERQPTRGIRQFVVGTGGKSHHGFGTIKANSEVRSAGTFGVLALTLNSGSYSWRFRPEAGKTFTDSGTGPCVTAGSATGSPSPDTTAPTAPTGLTGTAASSSRVDLKWTASSDNVGVTGYDIYRDGSKIATASATTYSDTSVAGATTYSYQVRARDAAGNVSPASNTATLSTPAAAPAGTTLRFLPQSDAAVDEASPGTNYGSQELRVNGGPDPDVDSYLRFAVSGLSRSVTSARLRLYATSATVDGPAVYGTSNSWSELGITWSNRPPRATAALADSGAVADNTVFEYDVTSYVRGDGTYSFDLGTTSVDGLNFHSREGTNKPELVVTTG